jgi:hypothetical protein
MLPYNWRDMANLSNLRQKMNENAMVVSIVLIVVIIVGLYLVLRSAGVIHPTLLPSKAYFVDLEDPNTPILLPPNELPPLIGKSGKPTVVGVLYYTCTDCKDKKPAYFMKYTEEAKAAVESMKKSEGSGTPPMGMPVAMVLEQGAYLCTPEGLASDHWVQMRSSEGAQIMAEARFRCGADPAAVAKYKICAPGD